MVVELATPYILLHEKKLSGLQALLPLLKTTEQSGRPLLIVAEDVEGELATFVATQAAWWSESGGRHGTWPRPARWPTRNSGRPGPAHHRHSPTSPEPLNDLDVGAAATGYQVP